jgi:hypothetical protein
MAKILNPTTNFSPVAITAKQPVAHNGQVVQPGEVIHVSEKVAKKLLASGESWGPVEKESQAQAPGAQTPRATEAADSTPARKPAA